MTETRNVTIECIQWKGDNLSDVYIFVRRNDSDATLFRSGEELILITKGFGGSTPTYHDIPRDAWIGGMLGYLVPIRQLPEPIHLQTGG